MLRTRLCNAQCVDQDFGCGALWWTIWRDIQTNGAPALSAVKPSLQGMICGNMNKFTVQTASTPARRVRRALRCAATWWFISGLTPSRINNGD